MTLKEIAELAQVSASTVSKILNHKDENISQDTRARVLQIVKQYQYAPYTKTAFVGPSHLLGVMLSDSTSKLTLSQQLAVTARKNGYSLLLCPFSSEEEEKHCLELFQAHRVDGYLREVLPDRPAVKGKDCETPAILFSMNQTSDPDCYAVSYLKMGYLCAQTLIDARHQQFLCLTEDEASNSRAFLQGFKQCLFDTKIPFDATMHHIWRKGMADPPFLTHSYTGATCCTAALASRVLRHVQDLNLHVPRDFSICCVKHHHVPRHIKPKINCIDVPTDSLAQQICQILIDRIEQRTPQALALEYRMTSGESVDIPATLRDKKILVIGAINMDILLNTERLPEAGETITVKNRLSMPGGKGLNQALGAARLGADTYLIGKIGKDYDGSSLYDFMNANHLNTEGVIMAEGLTTGNAYISVQNNGESCISIFNGANDHLTKENIGQFETLFENASFCLLQTEIHTGVIEYAAKLAHKHHVKTILKPCDVSTLDDELLKNIDILIPNKKEADRLLPHLKTCEEKAAYFRAKGVETVIITLSADGCYLCDETHSSYFAAANFTPVDTTGAADAFASALAVYLSRNYTMEVALRYATCAAGFSITRQGVPPSLVDQHTLEFHLSDSLSN